jgi:hypothetical protein
MDSWRSWERADSVLTSLNPLPSEAITSFSGRIKAIEGKLERYVKFVVEPAREPMGGGKSSSKEGRIRNITLMMAHMKKITCTAIPENSIGNISKCQRINTLIILAPIAQITSIAGIKRDGK